MKYSSRKDTLKHIRQVRKNIYKIIYALLGRARWHDWSKLQEYEKPYFDKYTPKLAGVTYGSEEYKQLLKELEPALEHHYDVNRHHPEHFNYPHLEQMNLVDILEMFCDWYAATKRHNDGDIMKSISINQKRFGYSDDVKHILESTYLTLFKPGEKK